MKSKKKIGFIILRHVNSNLTNKYWLKCIKSIRKYYKYNHILIIDDSSNYNYINQNHKDIEIFIKNNPINKYNTTIINSEFPKRGEILPYYYFLKNKLFDIAVIIHDSVFLNSYIDFNIDNYKFIWHFNNNQNRHWSKENNKKQVYDEIKMIKLFNDDKLLNFYNSNSWDCCFGCMSVINYDFLKTVNDRYKLDILLDSILNRNNRHSLERVLACLFGIMHKNISVIGNIFKYIEYGINFVDIETEKKYNDSIRYPILKVWTGR